MRALAAAALMFAGASVPAMAQHLPPIGGPTTSSFTATLSNNTPLAFGMDAQETQRALGSHLNYVSGRPGNEVFLAFRNPFRDGFDYPRLRNRTQAYTQECLKFPKRLGHGIRVKGNPRIFS